MPRTKKAQTIAPAEEKEQLVVETQEVEKKEKPAQKKSSAKKSTKKAEEGKKSAAKKPATKKVANKPAAENTAEKAAEKTAEKTAEKAAKKPTANKKAAKKPAKQAATSASAVEETVVPAPKTSKKAKSSRKKKAGKKTAAPKAQRRSAQKALIEQAKEVKIERIVETSMENERKKQILETALAKIKAQEEEDARREEFEAQKRARRKISFYFNFFASLGIMLLMIGLFFVVINRLTFANEVQRAIPTYNPQEASLANWLVTMTYFLFGSTMLLTGLVVGLFILSTLSKWKYQQTGEISSVHEATWMVSLMTFVSSIIALALSIVVLVLTNSYYTVFATSGNAFWTLFPVIADVVAFGLTLTIMILAINANKKLKS